MKTKFEQHILPNGLKIFFYKDPNKHSTEFHLMINFGGINGDFVLDGKKYHLENGMAHLLEHLLLEHSQYGCLTTELDKMHMASNGCTNINTTRYYFDAVENLEKGIEMMIRGINEPVFTKQDLEETKPAIYEEIRISDDKKYKALFKLTCQQIFKKIPYINTIGTAFDVKNFNIDLVTKAYQAFYKPSNQMILVGGNFDEQKVLKQITDIYNMLPKNDHQVEIIRYDEPETVTKKYASQKFNTGQDLMAITYKFDISNLTPDQKLELDFYLICLGEMNISVTSPLHKKLINDVVGGLSFSDLVFQDTLTFAIEAFVKNEKEFIDKVTEQFNNPILDEELFTLYQIESKVHIATRLEKIDKILYPLITNLTVYKCFTIDTVEQIDSYSFENFKKMINQLNFNNYVITKIEKQSI